MLHLQSACLNIRSVRKLIFPIIPAPHKCSIPPHGVSPFSVSSGFRQPVFSPCRQLHSLHLFYFPPRPSLLLCDLFLSLFGVLFSFCDVVPDLVSVSPSSRQMADLGVMVRCLGGVDSLQGEGFYISRRSVRENPCPLSVLSFPLCYTHFELLSTQ